MLRRRKLELLYRGAFVQRRHPSSTSKSLELEEGVIPTGDDGRLNNR